MTLSEFTAQMLMKGRVNTSYVFYVHPDEIEAITREFAAIGNNLNQIAAFFNSGGIQSRAMLENINHAIACIFEMREQVAEMAGKNYGNLKAYRK
ncbi:plasmid mobilization relaxosome protein MobC [Faecalibacterium sp. OF04-11AC]|uniref:plasmid mobilization relaxosome protein MobC n=1 Tax=Faecalibacterium sp. OF04-11AC TaxID=2293109 RepID=UPI001314C7C7|nr:plasmid mobilization relaxosome protein MobC [Faecalibacterium sp. OF04-11AC]